MRDLSPGQFGQLPMLLPAKALVDPANVLHRDTGWHDQESRPIENDTTAAMLGRKLHETMRTGGIYESVKAEGVREPVSLYRPPAGEGDNPGAKVEMMDGHHRLAASYKANPDREVPVTWYDPFISR